MDAGRRRQISLNEERTRIEVKLFVCSGGGFRAPVEIIRIYWRYAMDEVLSSPGK